MLNQIERWFALLTSRKIKRGSHSSVRKLIAAIEEFLDSTNKEHKPFNWNKTPEQIPKAIARFASRTFHVKAPDFYKKSMTQETSVACETLGGAFSGVAAGTLRSRSFGKKRLHLYL